MQQLEQLIVDNLSADELVKSTTNNQQLISSNNHSGKILSVETLIDCLLVLYDECNNSSLRREKTVSDFIELCECTRKFLNFSFSPKKK